MKLWTLKRRQSMSTEVVGFVLWAEHEAVARNWAAENCGPEGSAEWMDTSRSTCVEETAPSAGDVALVWRMRHGIRPRSS